MSILMPIHWCQSWADLFWPVDPFKLGKINSYLTGDILCIAEISSQHARVTEAYIE
jgi:hypothetical protein